MCMLEIRLIFVENKKDLSIFFPYDRINSYPVGQAERKEKDMFRLWAREFKDNRMLRDTVIADDSQDTRTHKIFRALDQVCYEFDLGKPIWLEATVAEFKRHSKARFRQDNFMEEIPFDYLEIQVIEEN